MSSLAQAFPGRDPRFEVEQGLRQLIAWAVSQPAIPEAAMRKAALILADNVAATIAARDEPEVRAVRDQFLQRTAEKEATLFLGGRDRTDRYSAALANGIAGSWCELDEGYRGAPAHAGLYVLPALLAEAEAADLSAETVLRCLVLAYEITGRFAHTWVFPSMEVHPHPAFGAIGGAAASALARGLDAERFFSALTAAATLINVGNYVHAVRGALVRNAWAAVGTQNGMRAVDWAQCGIGGMPDSPYEIFTTVLKVTPRPESLTAGLGSEWAITQGYHKVHGCCQSTHSAVEAALAARDNLPAGKKITDIAGIILDTHRPAMTNVSPETTLAARFSFEHVLAAALVYGHAGPEAFSTEAVDHPDVRTLRGRIELRRFEPALPKPNDRPARLSIVLKDGTRIDTECLSAPGGPDQPFAEERIVAKAEEIAGAVYPGFGNTVRRLLARDKATMQTGWRAITGQLVS